MQRTGERPDYGVKSPELAELVCRPPGDGPFVSLYCETEAAVENAAPLSEAHWRALRDDLASQGAPEGVLGFIDPVVSEAHGSDDMLAEELASLLAAHSNRTDSDLAELIRADGGSSGRAVTGWPEVVSALVAARVDTLVVEDGASEPATAWFGEDPLQAAATEGDLRAMGVDEPREGNRTDVAIRAAFGGGASVRIAGSQGPLAGEPSALLRWSEGR